MPPDSPYRAAIDDAMAVYKAAPGMVDPSHVGIFGTSTGGCMTLAMVLRAKAEGLTLPGAIAPGTPWADMTGASDASGTNEWVEGTMFARRGRKNVPARPTGDSAVAPGATDPYTECHGSRSRQATTVRDQREARGP